MYKQNDYKNEKHRKEYVKWRYHRSSQSYDATK